MDSILDFFITTPNNAYCHLLITEVISRYYVAFSNCLGGGPTIEIWRRLLLYEQSYFIANN